MFRNCFIFVSSLKNNIKNNVKFSLSFGHFAGAKNSKEKYWKTVKTALAGGQIAVIILTGLIVGIGEIVDPKFFISKG